MAIAEHRPALDLLRNARRALSMKQEEFAQVIGVSLRTLARIEAGRSPIYVDHYKAAAVRVHPVDRGLAISLARGAGETLVSLGLESPPTPSPVVAEAPPVAPALRDTLSEEQLHQALAHSILLAASEAIGISTVAMKSGLIAALARAHELKMPVEKLEAVLKASVAPAPPVAAAEE